MKKFLKYWGISFIFIWALMLVHYPAVYYDGTMIEYLLDFDGYSRYIIVTALILYWSLLFIPFLIISKIKYIGNIIIGTFSFFVGFEKYMFFIQGNHTAWNIGFNDSMLINFLSVSPINGLKDAIQTYSGDINLYIYLILMPIVIFSIIKIISRYLPKFEIPYIGWIALVGILVVPLTFTTPSAPPYMYRVMYTIDTHIIEKAYEIILDFKRKPIYFKEFNETKQPENIIVIVDESIRGDLVSINNQKLKNEQPFLYSLKDKIINFGNLYSPANCSDKANSLIMTGVSINKETKKPEYNLALSPTVLQYMKNAGYQTYFLDAVNNSLFYGLHNYDRRYIDNYFTAYNEETMKKDLKVLDKLKEILKKPGKKFIYIIKQGMHFPFENNFDHKNPIHKDWGKKTHKEYFNTYLNGLKTTVDDYWKKTIDIINNTDSVVFWQSDHAVNITPDIGNNEIYITHCEFQFTHWETQYNVPSFMYSPNKKYYEGYHNLKNGYSAKHILPTILDIAGYNEKNVKEFYGSNYKNPDNKIPLFNIDENRFFYLNDENVSRLINKEVKIDPLNKRRDLNNSLPKQELIK